MDKETYAKRVQELNHIKQKALDYNRKEREKADESYIAENCPFKVGDKAIYKGKPGTIETIKTTSDGSFEYYFRPNKKDGTPSLKGTNVYWYNRGLEKA